MARLWKDRVVEKPRTFTLQNNPDGTVTLIPAPGVIVEAGTPVNAANLNGLENDLETHKADNAQHSQKLPLLKGVIGVDPYVMPGWSISKNGGQFDFANNTIYYIPIYIANDTIFKGVQLQIATSKALANVEMRIYKSNIDLIPTDEVRNVGIFDASVAGYAEIVANFTLIAGYYFVGLRGSGLPVIYRGVINTSPVTSRLAYNYYKAVGTMSNPAVLPTGFDWGEYVPWVQFKI